MTQADPRKIVDLRLLLAERFPGRVEQGRAGVVETGLGCLDVPLGGGLPRGEVVEVTAGGPSSGSGLLLAALLQRVSEAHACVALVDGSDSFDPGVLTAGVLRRVLWVRCSNAAEALRPVDALLRDGNLPVVVLDLRGNTAGDLRGISPHAWFRFQRLAAVRGVVLVVVTPRAMVGSARWRLRLDGEFDLGALDREQVELLKVLRVEIVRGRCAQRTLPAHAEAG